METNRVDFSDFKFRASSTGKIMTDPQKGKSGLSETCKVHLVDVFVQNKYGRQTDITTKYMEKGLMVEEDSITLYSRVKKTFFKKNETHLNNAFVRGTPDLYTGLEIHSADSIIDIKSSWDIYTFFRVHTKELNKDYYWQLQTYMALSGARSAKLVYCLVDTPLTLILDEKRRLFYKMNAGTEENPEYQEGCEAIEKAMTFSDIPMNERVIEFDVERNDADIERLYKRVAECRIFLNELETRLNPNAVLARYDSEVKATVLENA